MALTTQEIIDLPNELASSRFILLRWHLSGQHHPASCQRHDGATAPESLRDWCTPIVGWVANHFGPRWALGVGAASEFAAAIVAVRAVSGQRTCTDERSSDVAAREGVK
jgi:hypothetical protein